MTNFLFTDEDGAIHVDNVPYGEVVINARKKFIRKHQHHCHDFHYAKINIPESSNNRKDRSKEANLFGSRYLTKI